MFSCGSWVDACSLESKQSLTLLPVQECKLHTRKIFSEACSLQGINATRAQTADLCPASRCGGSYCRLLPHQPLLPMVHGDVIFQQNAAHLLQKEERAACLLGQQTTASHRFAWHEQQERQFLPENSVHQPLKDNLVAEIIWRARWAPPCEYVDVAMPFGPCPNNAIVPNSKTAFRLQGSS